MIKGEPDGKLLKTKCENEQDSIIKMVNYLARVEKKASNQSEI